MEAMLSREELEKIGRDVIATGKLKALRQHLGLSCSYMSELLGVSSIAYRSWESRPDVRLWQNTAIRVGRWYDSVLDQLDHLDVVDEPLRNLIPLQMAAPLLGLPQEVLLRRYRDGEFDAVDLGLLGLWLHRSDFAEMRRAA